MDERFRGKGLWIGLGGVALIFLCVMMCGLGTMATMFMSRGADYVVPPAVEEGAPPPPAAYGHGPVARGGSFAHGPFGFLGSVLGGLFKLAVFGLLFLVIIKMVMRLLWRHRACGPRHGGKPPAGDPGDWGPPWRAWHKHHRHWGPGCGPPGKASPPSGEGDASPQTGEGDASPQAPDWYTSQQEGEPDQENTAAG